MQGDFCWDTQEVKSDLLIKNSDKLRVKGLCFHSNIFRKIL